jgi:hypothetical protein
MKSREIALCGMLNALAVVLMNLGSLVPLATFCTPLLAMLVLLPVLEEYGPRMGWAAWVSVSILSLLLVTDRETALVYVFFGWYPMVRPKVAAIKSKVLRFGVKLLICNGLIFTLYGLVLRLMGLTADLLDSTRLMNALLLILGNLVFFLTDLVLQRMTLVWTVKLRKRFFK